MIRLRLEIVLTALLALYAQSVWAQDFPTHRVHMIVPFSAGTGADVSGRFIADRLAREWGVPVTVENKVGANGIIGAEAVAKAAPDGYTLAFTASTHLVNQTLYRSLPFHTVRDFRPVVRVSNTYLVLVVPTSAPVSTLQELIDYAKARPGQLNYSSGGSGSATHLAGALLNSMAGIDVAHIPYKGGAQALADTMSGQVLFTFTAIPTAASAIKAGKLKALGLSGRKRSAALPDVPSLEEAGLKGFEIVAWSGILAPAGTPDNVVRKISDSVMKIARQPDFAELMGAQGLEAEATGIDQFTIDYPQEAERWARIVRLSGARAD